MISSVPAATSVDIFFDVAASCSNCASVASTVFRTDVKPANKKSSSKMDMEEEKYADSR